MQKMNTVFQIDRENKIVINKVVPASEWVLNNEGKATIKFDGTSCKIENGILFKRHDRKFTKGWKRYVKKNGGVKNVTIDPQMYKPAPEGFVPCEDHPDPNTGHWPGWVPIDKNSSEDRYHFEGFINSGGEGLPDGTYELVGPKIQNNPYGLDQHELWAHGSIEVYVERTFEGIKNWLETFKQEGLVFIHEDGRMAKIRRKDFDLPWND